jgi:hypothetical protein
MRKTKKVKTKNKAKTKPLVNRRKKYRPRLPKPNVLNKLPHRMLVIYAFNAVKLMPRWQKDAIAVNIATLVQSWLDSNGNKEEIKRACDIYSLTEDLGMPRPSDIAIAFSWVCDVIIENCESFPYAGDSAASATSKVLEYTPRGAKSRIRTKIVKNYKELRDFDKIVDRYLLDLV